MVSWSSVITSKKALTKLFYCVRALTAIHLCKQSPTGDTGGGDFSIFKTHLAQPLYRQPLELTVVQVGVEAARFEQ